MAKTSSVYLRLFLLPLPHLRRTWKITGFAEKNLCGKCLKWKGCCTGAIPTSRQLEIFIQEHRGPLRLDTYLAAVDDKDALCVLSCSGCSTLPARTAFLAVEPCGFFRLSAGSSLRMLGMGRHPMFHGVSETQRLFSTWFSRSVARGVSAVDATACRNHR